MSVFKSRFNFHLTRNVNSIDRAGLFACIALISLKHETIRTVDTPGPKVTVHELAGKSRLT